MEDNKLRSQIELQRFLTPDQIEEILDKAVQTNAANDYVGKVQIQALLDALNSRGFTFENKFQIEGNEAIPRGTYVFLGEEDLGRPLGKCENYGCGHPIRYLEHIRHSESGKEYVVGNVCVTHLLGKHDLVQIAIALLSKISKQVDKLNKIKKIKQILGTLQTQINAADPNHYFTGEEHKYFAAVSRNQKNVSIRKAQEISEKWRAFGKLSELENMVKQRDDKMNGANPKQERLDEITSWLDFLYYKQWDNKGRNVNSDFISNCIEEIKVHDQLSESRRDSLKSEKEKYDAIRSADPSLLINIVSREDRVIVSKMLHHSKLCSSFFVVSLIFKADHFGNLTPGQKNALKDICRHCGKPIL